jgi:hypothetical protein
MSQVNGKLEIIAASFQAINLEQPSREQVSPSCLRSVEAEATESRSVLGIPPRAVPEPRARSSDSILTRTMQKSLDLGLGLLSLQTTAKSLKAFGNDSREEKDAKSTRKLFTVRFLCRFATCRRGFRICTDDTFDNWTFNTIRRRPWNSDIFLLCRRGDIGGVKKLLDYGEASLFDVDEDGASPLHVRSPATRRLLRVN